MTFSSPRTPTRGRVTSVAGRRAWTSEPGVERASEGVDTAQKRLATKYARPLGAAPILGHRLDQRGAQGCSAGEERRGGKKGRRTAPRGEWSPSRRRRRRP